MQNIRTLFALAAALLALSLTHCQKPRHWTQVPIKIGSGAETLSELTLPRKSQRDILLSGGNGKFNVSIADSRIATARVSQDTLSIKGLREGETFATIRTMDQEAQLTIRIQPNELRFTQSSITLRPTELNRAVTLGGGTIVTLTVDDPDRAVDVKWRKSGILEIQGLAEGKATVTAHSEGLEDKTLEITVACRDEKHFLQQAGLYKNSNKSLIEKMRARAIVSNRQIGLLLRENPALGRSIGSLPSNQQGFIQVAPVINPQIGEEITLKVTTNIKDAFAKESFKARVVSIDTERELVVLNGRRTKYVLPYFSR